MGERRDVELSPGDVQPFAQHRRNFPVGFDAPMRAGMITREARDYAPGIRERLASLCAEIPDCGFEVGNELKSYSRTLEKIRTSDEDPFVDALRYGVILSVDSFVQGFQQVVSRLERFGFREHERRNHWVGSQAYLPLGISSHLEDVETGYLFQVRFFTPQQRSMVERAHVVYRQYRSVGLSQSELHDLQRPFYEGIERPEGVELIPSFQRSLNLKQPDRQCLSMDIARVALA